MVKDPVCGMDVDPKTAANKSEYKGQMYCFCSPDVRRISKRIRKNTSIRKNTATRTNLGKNIPYSDVKEPWIELAWMAENKPRASLFHADMWHPIKLP